MIGLATDHGTQCHQRIKAAALRHGLEGQRQFQRAGHRRVSHIGISNAEARQFGQASRAQALADVLVEAGLRHADAQPAACQIGFYFTDRHLSTFPPAPCPRQEVTAVRRCAAPCDDWRPFGRPCGALMPFSPRPV